MWTHLKSGIQEVLYTNYMNSDVFEELYRYAYSLTLHKRGDIVYNGVKEVIREHLVNEVSKLDCCFR